MAEMQQRWVAGQGGPMTKFWRAVSTTCLVPGRDGRPARTRRVIASLARLPPAGVMSLRSTTALTVAQRETLPENEIGRSLPSQLVAWPGKVESKIGCDLRVREWRVLAIRYEC